MTVYDISAPLRGDLPVWPGEQGLRRELVAEQPEDPATVSHLSLGAHTGTHVDAPVHFLPGGGGVETFPPDAFVGRCHVVDLRGVHERIGADDLSRADLPAGAERILARTRNSGWSRTDRAFREDYVAYDPSAAQWCLDRGVRLLGIDYVSIETFAAQHDGFPVHKALLGAGVAVLEGLDLDGVAAGAYDLAALPLLLPGSDGAPARAVLVG
ncbi:MAG: cyclase family protein [Egibacteraceae bacterium]